MDNKDRLEQTAKDGDLVRQVFQHPGMAILRDRMDKETGRAHNAWLTAKPEEAEALRVAASGYSRIFDIAKEVMLHGDKARQILEKSQIPQAE